MIRTLIRTLPLSLALAATLAAAPAADAQRRDRDRDRDDRRWEQRDDDRHRGKNDKHRVARNGRRVPPGWCTGRGNPHNTPENCGWRARRSDGRVYRDGRLVRVGDRDRRLGTSTRRYSTRASWDRAHRDYHAAYERTCQERVRRTSGWTEKLRVQRECSAQHERWHQLNRRPS